MFQKSRVAYKEIDNVMKHKCSYRRRKHILIMFTILVYSQQKWSFFHQHFCANRYLPSNISKPFKFKWNPIVVNSSLIPFVGQFAETLHQRIKIEKIDSNICNYLNEHEKHFIAFKLLLNLKKKLRNLFQLNMTKNEYKYKIGMHD